MEFNGKGQKWATYFDHFVNFSQFCHAKVLVNLTKKNWCSKLVQGDNGFSFFLKKMWLLYKIWKGCGRFFQYSLKKCIQPLYILPLKKMHLFFIHILKLDAECVNNAVNDQSQIFFSFVVANKRNSSMVA